jgi:predicted small secreted protein
MRNRLGYAAMLLLLLLGALPLLAACHTVQGAGEDISKTGQAIQNGVQKVTP